MSAPSLYTSTSFRVTIWGQRKRQKAIAFTPGATGTTPQPPADSPLKVWDGSQWVPAGVKVEE